MMAGKFPGVLFSSFTVFNYARPTVIVSEEQHRFLVNDITSTNKDIVRSTLDVKIKKWDPIEVMRLKQTMRYADYGSRAIMLDSQEI